ncbi:hypothetical protein BX666DRAFT_2142969 [Dichotomocladium elegans]|nr:hypothetical protein BX666DRAFT_2142969 [Dichotomocladium elegans]
MPPRDPTLVLTEASPCTLSDDTSINGTSLTSSIPRLVRPQRADTFDSNYSREELLAYAKCFAPEPPSISSSASFVAKALHTIRCIPSVFVRYGILLPVRLVALGFSSIGFFISLPVALGLNSKPMVATLVKYYCKGILFSLGTVPRYLGSKPWLSEPHVFVANHTSYLDYIVVSAHQYPHAVVMARHGGVLGFLQNNGLNFLHSMTFDRSNTQERKNLAQRLRQHVSNPQTWPSPMLIFPEGTCVNNKYTIRFQKGAFELGVKVCPVGIKYDRAWGDPYWDTRKGFMYYALYRMTRWCTPIDVVYCPPQEPKDGEHPAAYGERVKALISDTIGLENESFNGMAKRDLLQALTIVEDSA